jgi:hypothetical protein
MGVTNMDEYKEIYRDEDKCLRQIVGMNDCGAFEIKTEFTEAYGGSKYVSYVGSPAVRAMMKALEDLKNENKTN